MSWLFFTSQAFTFRTNPKLRSDFLFKLCSILDLAVAFNVTDEISKEFFFSFMCKLVLKNAVSLSIADQRGVYHVEAKAHSFKFRLGLKVVLDVIQVIWKRESFLSTNPMFTTIRVSKLIYKINVISVPDVIQVIWFRFSNSSITPNSSIFFSKTTLLSQLSVKVFPDVIKADMGHRASSSTINRNLISELIFKLYELVIIKVIWSRVSIFKDKITQSFLEKNLQVILF